MEQPNEISTTIINAIKAMNHTLAVINSRVEILMNAALPEYAMPDLIQIYEAEKQVSQIAHKLSMYCHDRF